ncbi:NUDIX hydrolase [Novosphingobium sp. KCTC 2891]|uniref:NUDIX hydrolase n=1 Tax=Novosphingobium sp. KCTC 2891 TaxID=2989730 RepID=UPI002222D6CB|nr:NUDIX hydrolase [Novosphingobium sp. KCTC 2891]MCW1383178.1 NUDIX hydrolase [Novosphingobium sp. KCTC 2891]
MSTLPATPRPAATVLLLRDDPFEVLMVRRNARGVFASALVFPGGMVEAEDASEDWLPHLRGHEGLSIEERAHRVAAARETWEEAAILLVREGDTACPLPPDRPEPTLFRQIVADSGGHLDLAALAPFGHWITPVDAPRRFDTRFYLAHVTREQEARCDGSETVEMEWIAPHEALDRARRGDAGIMFPTKLSLLRLTETPCPQTALAATLTRQVVPVLPVVEPREGGTVVFIPQDAGYAEWEEFTPHPPARG